MDWFPNGVDTGYFAPVAEPHDPELISFVGRMDYFPNEQSMVDSAPTRGRSCGARGPPCALQIVGADPTARVRDLARFRE